MALTRVDESLLLAAFFRGGSEEDVVWTSNTDQILTLSLFYTGEVSFDDCVDRFSVRSYVGGLYNSHGDLNCDIDVRYKELIALLHQHSELIRGGGDFKTPANPTYTSCRLTCAGMELAMTFLGRFPTKPDFPEWPDKRILLGIRH